MTAVSILLVDDHPVVREGYRRLLERQAGFRVSAEAESGDVAGDDESRVTLGQREGPDATPGEIMQDSRRAERRRRCSRRRRLTGGCGQRRRSRGLRRRRRRGLSAARDHRRRGEHNQ